MWLIGGSQRVEDPSDMLVTVAAEDLFDASPRLHRITAPTLLVAGDRDRFSTPELFLETAERIPAPLRASSCQDGPASLASRAASGAPPVQGSP